MAIERKQVAASQVEFKDAQGNKPGRMRLYFSTFDNWDSVRPVPERPVRGAFKKYLPDLLKKGFSSVNHDLSALPVATIADAGEDDKGAWAELEYHSTQGAQDAYTVAKERYQRGADVSASFAYLVHDDEYIDIVDDEGLKAQGITRGRELKELEVKELGFVNIPANPHATATAVKALKDTPTKRLGIKGMFEDALAEQTNDLWNLWQVFCCVVCDIQMMDESAEMLGVPYDMAGAVNEAVAEFSSRLVASIMAEDAEEDSADGGTSPGMGDMGMMSNGGKLEGKWTGLVHGLAYAALLETVVDAAKGLTTRTRTRKELRTKEGRMLSGSNMDKLKSLRASLTDVASALDELLAAASPTEDAGMGKSSGDTVEQIFARFYLRKQGATINGY